MTISLPAGAVPGHVSEEYDWDAELDEMRQCIEPAHGMAHIRHEIVANRVGRAQQPPHQPWLPSHFGRHPPGELASDRRARLRNILRRWPEPIQPRHQRGVQSRGHSKSRMRHR